MTKRLYRSRKEKMIAGVAGGLAEYLDIDPVFVRIAFVCLVFFHGAGIIIYFVSALIIPKEELFGTIKPEEEVNKEMDKLAAKARRKSYREKIVGAILIILGGIFLADNLLMDIDFENIFPLLLIAIGSWMVYNTFKKEKENELKIDSANKSENENLDEVQ